MFIAFVLSLLFFVSASSAESYISGDFEYTLLENGDAELIYYHGEEGNVMIPKMLDGTQLS